MNIKPQPKLRFFVIEWGDARTNIQIPNSYLIFEIKTRHFLSHYRAIFGLQNIKDEKRFLPYAVRTYY